MKKLLAIFISLYICSSAFSQKVDYKSNVISIDGKNIATVTKIKNKENFGLTSSFELNSLAGKKLIIATIATDFEPPRNDNSGLYYRFTFLTSGQVGIFGLSTLGPEKSFAKLIGESGIVVNDELDNAKVNEMIAVKGKNPRVKVVYNLVERNRMMNVRVKYSQVLQAEVVVGQFKDVSKGGGYDAYEFSLPSGLIVAKVSFTGGNSAKNCTITTFKDEQTQQVRLSGAYGELMVRSEGVDRNTNALEEISRWLVNNSYL